MDSDCDSSDSEIQLTLDNIFISNPKDGEELPYQQQFKQSKIKRHKTAEALYLKFGNVKVTDEFMKKEIIDDLSGKNFLRYMKFFKSNYKSSLDKSSKNLQKSMETRIKANKLFENSSLTAQVYKDVWELYCTSIGFAPAGSKELVLAYDCRSNLLLHLEEYEDCVKDIDRALSITNFDLLKVKLLCRKMTCFAAMGQDGREKLNVWVTLNSYMEKIDAVFKNEKFFQMIDQAMTDSTSESYKTENCDQSSSSITLCSKDVDMEISKEIRMVATRDFAPGEMVVVTKPLTTSFNPSLFYAYCSHCQSFMWGGIPCDECSLCMYCSEECKIEAWEKYHIFECKVLPHINIENVNYNILHLSTRVLLKAIKECGSILKVREKMEQIDRIRGHSQLDKNVFNSDFSKFYASLLPHINSSTMDILKMLVRHSCFLTAYLIQTCDFFEEKNLKSLRGKELAKVQEITDLGFIMLKILILNYTNIQFLGQVYTSMAPCEKYKDNIDCANNRHCIRGTYYDTHHAMFEKSCNPNVANCWTDDGKIIYYCVQPIKKMEKITIRRDLEFFVRDEEKRNEQINFTKNCQCAACSRHWPTMDVLFDKYKPRRRKEEFYAQHILYKYLSKNKSSDDFVSEEDCVFNDDEYLQLLRDVNEVIKIRAQPSFESSMMIRYVCLAFEKRYGTISLISHFSDKCTETLD